MAWTVGYPEAMPRRVRLALLASLVATAGSLVGCSSDAPLTPPSVTAGSTSSHGSVVIGVSGTYSYALGTECPSFKFSSDDGRSVWLDSRGAVYLTAGRWSGACYHEALSQPSSSPLPCVSPAVPTCSDFSVSTYAQQVSAAWLLTLTPIGSSY